MYFAKIKHSLQSKIVYQDKVDIINFNSCKERNMNGGSATADHVKDRRKKFKQKLFKIESATKHIL
jgi:hypothetical protein